MQKNIKVMNVFLGQGKGGMEQAFLDYSEALSLQGFTTMSVARRGSYVAKELLNLIPQYPNLQIFAEMGASVYNFYAKYSFRKLVKTFQPDVIICHGSRAVHFAYPYRKIIPIVGVMHNYNLKKQYNLPYIFSVSKGVKDFCIKEGYCAQRAFFQPNLIKLPTEKYSFDTSKKEIVIGSMGRLISIKGFVSFIEAIKIISESNFNIKVQIAGDGNEKEKLSKLISDLNLENIVSLVGWQTGEEKDQFFANIDIFCLPSLTESFGIVLLEAASWKKPIVTSNTNGPKELFQKDLEAVFFEKGNHMAMVDALMKVIKSESLRQKLSRQSYKVAQKYTLEPVSKMLKNNVLKVVSPLSHLYKQANL